MDKTEIFLEDGTKKIVNCIFYLYNNNYYFLYTENEKDENGYIKLYLVKVGKETVNSDNGPVETGNMIGIEVPTLDEWKEVQGSISKIVNSKKTKVEDSSIQYLPINMLVNLKILSKKSFRLLSGIIEKDFGVVLDKKNDESIVVENKDSNENSISSNSLENIQNESNELSSTDLFPEGSNSDSVTNINQGDEIIDELNNDISTTNDIKEDHEEIQDSFEITTAEVDDASDQEIIIDYRTKFFEEQEKNKKLNDEIEKLNKKLNDIKEIISKD